MKNGVAIIGLGFVGSAMFESFKQKEVPNLIGYDKYKKIGNFEECLKAEIVFLVLPTPYHEEKREYDKSAIYETLELLHSHNYEGIVVIKSTVEPESTKSFSSKYPLRLIHNPEFLTERTAFEDFHHQKHIVLGLGPNCKESELTYLLDFYQRYYPLAKISSCSSDESESMKIFANSFYSVKVQFFNELYLLCQKMNCSYDVVKNLMLENGWINSMHTQVPGPDGKLSYGGSCFPKDTNALLKFMKKYESPAAVLEATIAERNSMRPDNTNVI